MKDSKESVKKEEKPVEPAAENVENKEKEKNKENENADVGKNDENQEKVSEAQPDGSTEKRHSKTNIFTSAIKYENIYTEEKIKEIMENKDNIKDIITRLYMDLFKARGEKMKSNQIKAITNFHCQSMTFILEKFGAYPLEIITKLANIFSLLLNLKEDEYNLQLKTMENNPEEPVKIIPEPDFCYIINKKIMEIKTCFSKLKLFPDQKNRSTQENHFYLTNQELNIILDYLNQCYFPLIRLFYHVINLNRIETKKIHSMMTKPMAVPNAEDMDNAPEKFIIEEQVKRPESKEKVIDNKIKDSLMNKYGLNEDEYSKIGNDGYNKLNITKGDYAEEVRKLITEKVNELKKDVDAKISENQTEIEKNIQNIKEQYTPANKKK